ncbi:hypothetical protein NQ318_015579 [Aromia moschata]|uniref:Uncharacterized protein n=1 Tax=Aromia moschata TaxID=1265417 RepID=A0AAV8XDA8_9CUCU|nr:hypothetical protein NQ318_015579 [Aromia moschata]
MNRSEGFVKRRNVARDNSEGLNKEEQSNEKKAGRDEDVDDGDSKETRLTLMEELWYFKRTKKKQFRMDSFFSLFDPNGCSDCSTDEFAIDNMNNQNSLPPEPQLGNVEYKLKIVNPTKQRFEHLVTQIFKKIKTN